MSSIREIRFQLSISASDYLAYYRGEAGQVAVRTIDGRNVRFPANILRPYLSHSGIVGDFVLQFDTDNRVVGIRRL